MVQFYGLRGGQLLMLSPPCPLETNVGAKRNPTVDVPLSQATAHV
jgi:hypothetical protein